MIYDPFQKEAMECINQGHSVIVSAPTGAGKTVIAEHVIEKCIRENVGVIYSAPIKALSNQKFRDFQERFPGQIGILTGDVSLNQEAPVLIMTTEILRNKLLEERSQLERYSWVIFDEIHYLDNYERGTVWEESLIFMPEQMNILGLSATIPNIKEISSWIESIHKKTVKVIIEDKRPVPLHFFYQYHNQVVDRIEKMRRSRQGASNRLSALLTHIRNNNGLPCIYFVFGRKRAEELAFETSGFDFLNKEEKEEISALYESLCQRFDLKHEKSAVMQLPLIRRGIAYHHAGMLPTLKEVIERLFTSRLLKVIFTTETFALGINMPSRSVIFDNLKKFYGRNFRCLKTRDFYQMAGRAGRRGIDREGFVYSRINANRISPEETKKIIYSRPEEVRSQFNTSYATLLNLYQKYQDSLFDIYPLTLHCFQSKRQHQKQALGLMQAKLDLLKESGYIEKESLTTKGEFAKDVYGYELILSELFSMNAFEYLDEFGLGVLAVAAVFEPRKNQQILSLSKPNRKIRSLCEETFAKIKDKEYRFRIRPFSKMPYFHLAEATSAWLRGTEFSKILRLTDTDEGEVIRYFRMGIQTLRQMKDNKAASYILKDRIIETIRIMNRDIVDAEKQLRES